jgi:hypothetical protein
MMRAWAHMKKSCMPAMNLTIICFGFDQNEYRKSDFLVQWVYLNLGYFFVVQVLRHALILSGTYHKESFVFRKTNARTSHIILYSSMPLIKIYQPTQFLDQKFPLNHPAFTKTKHPGHYLAH